MVKRGLLGFAIMILLLTGAGTVAAQIDPQLRAAVYAVDVAYLQDQLQVWQQQSDSSEKHTYVAFILNILTDYHDFIGPEVGLQAYTDQVIAAAEQGLEYDDQEAILYVLLAEGYARKITGALTGIRYGGRLGRTVETAESLDADSEDLLYLQAKRYLLAPSLGGGDRARAREVLAQLTEQYPESYLYLLLYSQAMVDTDVVRAEELATAAEELRKQP